ncbi:MAG: chromate efflux transporter [Hyphomicrobiales bacterium]
MTNPTPSDHSFRDLFRAFGKIGVLSFGGPAGQIALMHKVVVEEKRWLSEQQYLSALSFCMLLPGPEAMQLATYAGWRIKGVVGGLIAGLLFVLPGALVILLLASLYAGFGAVPLVGVIFLGIKAAVVVIVIEALIKVARRALKRLDYWVIAGLAFIALFSLNLPFPLIILLAAGYGAVMIDKVDDRSPTVALVQSFAGTVKTAAIWLFIWLVPLAALWLVLPDHVLTEIGLFFSKLAVVTFGGAYAVLAYMAQDVVQGFGWLEAGQMMDGLGLAETTPGPLILVTEFVGFLAGFSQGGYGLAFIAAFITLWMTFAPCFLWIFTFAPYVEWISDQPRLKGALAGITAAVVGVILNLSIWFALHVFFADVQQVQWAAFKIWLPELATLDWRVVILALISAVLLLRLKWSVLMVLAVMVVCGVGLSLAGF